MSRIPSSIRSIATDADADHDAASFVTPCPTEER